MADFSLVDLCLAHLARHIPAYAPDLTYLPLDLAERLFWHVVSLCPPFLPQASPKKATYAVQASGPTPNLLDLHILADQFWRPWEVKLGFTSSLSRHCALLPMFSESLIRLRLSGGCCIDDLAFLTSLQKLQCLDVSGSSLKLDSQQVSSIVTVPSLRCLNLSNSQIIGDPQKELLDQVLAGLPQLRALDVSGLPSVDNSTMNLLTYGHQYARWQASVQQAYERQAARRPLIGHSVDKFDGPELWPDESSPQYPLTAFVYLRAAACEQLTDKVADYLSALPHIAFLDLRFTPNCRGASLATLKARHGLTALPNNSKLLFRSNATLKAALDGACGCRALAKGGVYILDNERKGSLDALSFEHPSLEGRQPKRWEEEGLALLFRAEDKVGSSPMAFI